MGEHTVGEIGKGSRFIIKTENSSFTFPTLTPIPKFWRNWTDYWFENLDKLARPPLNQFWKDERFLQALLLLEYTKPEKVELEAQVYGPNERADFLIGTTSGLRLVELKKMSASKNHIAADILKCASWLLNQDPKTTPRAFLLILRKHKKEGENYTSVLPKTRTFLKNILTSNSGKKQIVKSLIQAEHINLSFDLAKVGKCEVMSLIEVKIESSLTPDHLNNGVFVDDGEDSGIEELSNTEEVSEEAD